MSKTPLSSEEISELERLSIMVDQEQHYRLLDVGRHSEASIVQAAYYKHSRKWHPDAFFRKDVGEYGPVIDKIFMGLTQAFQVLSDPKKKQQYDRKYPAQKASTIRHLCRCCSVREDGHSVDTNANILHYH